MIWAELSYGELEDFGESDGTEECFLVKLSRTMRIREEEKKRPL